MHGRAAAQSCAVCLRQPAAPLRARGRERWRACSRMVSCSWRATPGIGRAMVRLEPPRGPAPVAARWSLSTGARRRDLEAAPEPQWTPQVGVGVLAATSHADPSTVLSRVSDMSRIARSYREPHRALRRSVGPHFGAAFRPTRPEATCGSVARVRALRPRPLAGSSAIWPAASSCQATPARIAPRRARHGPRHRHRRRRPHLRGGGQHADAHLRHPGAWPASRSPRRRC